MYLKIRYAICSIYLLISAEGNGCRGWSLGVWLSNLSFETSYLEILVSCSFWPSKFVSFTCLQFNTLLNNISFCRWLFVLVFVGKMLESILLTHFLFWSFRLMTFFWWVLSLSIIFDSTFNLARSDHTLPSTFMSKTLLWRVSQLWLLVIRVNTGFSPFQTSVTQYAITFLCTYAVQKLVQKTWVDPEKVWSGYYSSDCLVGTKYFYVEHRTIFQDYAYCFLLHFSPC